MLVEQLAVADIIALQESFVSADANTASFIADKLGYGTLIEEARRKVRVCDGRSVAPSSGLALLSRWPLQGVECISLPSDPVDGERIAQIAICATPLGAITLVNTHLTHLPGADDLRRMQLETILNRLKRSQVCSFFLCGDMNADPRSPAISYLSRLTDFRLRDACAECENRFATLVGSSRRIDYVFLLEKQPQFSIVDAVRIADRSGRATPDLPSDHYGVMARIRNTNPLHGRQI